jgi:hypothetical protein
VGVIGFSDDPGEIQTIPEAPALISDEAKPQDRQKSFPKTKIIRFLFCYSDYWYYLCGV